MISVEFVWAVAQNITTSLPKGQNQSYASPLFSPCDVSRRTDQEDILSPPIADCSLCILARSLVKYEVLRFPPTLPSIPSLAQKALRCDTHGRDTVVTTIFLLRVSSHTRIATLAFILLRVLSSSRTHAQTIFPDNAYGVDSGGDPTAIPSLTFDYFKGFHKRFYHPGNSRVYFYGDDPPLQVI